MFWAFKAILNSFVPACPESGQLEIVCKSRMHDLNLRKIEGGRRRARFEYTHPLFSGIWTILEKGLPDQGFCLLPCLVNKLDFVIKWSVATLFWPQGPWSPKTGQMLVFFWCLVKVSAHGCMKAAPSILYITRRGFWTRELGSWNYPLLGPGIFLYPHKCTDLYKKSKVGQKLHDHKHNIFLSIGWWMFSIDPQKQ